MKTVQSSHFLLNLQISEVEWAFRFCLQIQQINSRTCIFNPILLAELAIWSYGLFCSITVLMFSFSGVLTVLWGPASDPLMRYAWDPCERYFFSHVEPCYFTGENALSSYIYILYVSWSWPNGWTEWDEKGWTKFRNLFKNSNLKKKIIFFKLKKILGQRISLQLVVF